MVWSVSYLRPKVDKVPSLIVIQIGRLDPYESVLVDPYSRTLFRQEQRLLLLLWHPEWPMRLATW